MRPHQSVPHYSFHICGSVGSGLSSGCVDRCRQKPRVAVRSPALYNGPTSGSSIKFAVPRSLLSHTDSGMLSAVQASSSALFGTFCRGLLLSSQRTPPSDSLLPVPIARKSFIVHTFPHNTKALVRLAWKKITDTGDKIAPSSFLSLYAPADFLFLSVFSAMAPHRMA